MNGNYRFIIIREVCTWETSPGLPTEHIQLKTLQPLWLLCILMPEYGWSLKLYSTHICYFAHPVVSFKFLGLHCISEFLWVKLDSERRGQKNEWKSSLLLNYLISKWSKNFLSSKVSETEWSLKNISPYIRYINIIL